MVRKRSIKWGEFTDWIFPRLEGSEEELKKSEAEKAAVETKAVEEAVQRLQSNVEGLKAYLEEAEKLLEIEQSRRQSVEARLTSIVGLMSIAATVVLSGILAMATGTVPMHTFATKCVLVLGSLYLALQLYVALSAAVKGLSRQSGLFETGLDLFSARPGQEPQFLRSRIKRKLDHLADSRISTNAKLDRMAVAQVALRIFLAGLLFLAFAAALFALDRDPPRSVVPCLTKQALLCADATAVSEPADTFSPPSDSTSFRTSDLVWPVLMVASGIPLVFLGVFLVVAGPPLRRTGAGLALIASGLTLSVLGSSKIDLVAGKFENFIGQLEISLFAQRGASQSKIGLAQFAIVGPFPDGDHLLDGAPIIECLRAGLQSLPASAIVGWQIVGRVDKRGLRPDRAAIYGSNQALAMARAVWVRDHLLAMQDSFDSASAVVLVGGARHVGGSVDESHLKSDRVVEIYVLLQRAEPKTGAGTGTSSFPRSIICPS